MHRVCCYTRDVFELSYFHRSREFRGGVLFFIFSKEILQRLKRYF